MEDDAAQSRSGVTVSNFAEAGLEVRPQAFRPPAGPPLVPPPPSTTCGYAPGHGDGDDWSSRADLRRRAAVRQIRAAMIKYVDDQLRGCVEERVALYNMAVAILEGGASQAPGADLWGSADEAICQRIRFAHWMWESGRDDLLSEIQSRMDELQSMMQTAGLMDPEDGRTETVRAQIANLRQQVLDLPYFANLLPHDGPRNLTDACRRLAKLRELTASQTELPNIGRREGVATGELRRALVNDGAFADFLGEIVIDEKLATILAEDIWTRNDLERVQRAVMDRREDLVAELELEQLVLRPPREGRLPFAADDSNIARLQQRLREHDEVLAVIHNRLADTG